MCVGSTVSTHTRSKPSHIPPKQDLDTGFTGFWLRVCVERIVMRNEPGRAVVMLCWRACTLRMDAALRLMPGINDLRRPVVPLMYHAYLRISIVVGTKIKHYSLFLFVILFVRPDSVLSVLASCVLPKPLSSALKSNITLFVRVYNRHA